jgi:hypothetical protein
LQNRQAKRVPPESATVEAAQLLRRQQARKEAPAAMEVVHSQQARKEATGVDHQRLQQHPKHTVVVDQRAEHQKPLVELET